MPYASSSSTDVYEVFECISEVFELKLVMSVAERTPVAMLMLVRDNIDWGFERSESVREGTGDGEDGNPARDPFPRRNGGLMLCWPDEPGESERVIVLRIVLDIETVSSFNADGRRRDEDLVGTFGSTVRDVGETGDCVGESYNLLTEYGEGNDGTGGITFRRASGVRSGWFFKYVVRLLLLCVASISASVKPLARSWSTHSGGRPSKLRNNQ